MSEELRENTKLNNRAAAQPAQNCASRNKRAHCPRAHRTGPRDLRPDAGRGRSADRGAVPGPRAAGGRSGHREDADGEDAGAPARPGLPARAGHARPDARRHSGHLDSAARHRHFTFHAGPVFTDLLLVDEINRMPPRTQAALLECMEERQVTSDGTRRPLPSWFTVFATQNPVDFEGTYPLPEAQLDRFLMKIRVAYPTEAEELQILERHHAGTGASLLEDAAIAPIPAGMLEAARAEVRAIRIEPELYGYILALARRTREWPTLLLGASPRAALSIMRVAQAAAAFDGRDYLVPDDVKRAIPPVLRHRVMLKPEAELEGFDADRVLADVIAAVPVPRQ